MTIREEQDMLLGIIALLQIPNVPHPIEADQASCSLNAAAASGLVARSEKKSIFGL